MTQSALPARASIASARQRANRAEAIKQAWYDGRPPDAAVALAENPELAGDRAVALDLAYEEFCVRWEAGEILDSAAFCERFSFGASLRRLLAVHRFLDDHPEALGGSTTKWPAIGAPVGDFLVLRELGRGSFARVYLAVETTAGDRPVALKVSAAGSREADTLGPLSHPHLVPVLSSRPVGSWTTVAMPFVGTATLEDVLSTVGIRARGTAPRSAAALLEAAALGGRADDPPFPSRPAFPIRAEMTYEDGVVALAAGMCAAVAYLHERGIAHRDLKPSNVLLGPSGHPYLLDFNLASRVTDPWRLAGTLPYMPPEQLAVLAGTGAPPADARPGDVFACGVVLFELLTGRHPFGDPGALAPNSNRERVAAQLLAAQRAGHPGPAALNPRVRRVVRAALERCLALDPHERPTAAELAELFSRAGTRRSGRLVVPVLATAVAALALGYAALRPPTPPEARAATPELPVPVAPVAAPLTPFDRAWQLAQKGQYVPAVLEFQAIGEAQKDGRAYGFAVYCMSAGKYRPEEVIVIADEAIRLGFRDAATYANRAYNHLKATKPAAAKADCDEALRLDPNLPAALYTRAVAQLQLHSAGEAVPPEAIVDIERATVAMPDAPEVWSIAAQIYFCAATDQPDLRTRALRAVGNAVLSGKDVGAIRRNPILKVLAGDPVFEEALTWRPEAVPPPTNPHLASPNP